MGKEDEIRLIAYQIWEEEGCINGRDCEHWLRAESIWQRQQKEKFPAQNIKPESKPVAKPVSKAMPSGKKSTKTR